MSVTVIVLTVSGLPPEFVTVTVCVLPGASGSAVPKSMVVGLVVNEPLVGWPGTLTPVPVSPWINTGFSRG